MTRPQVSTHLAYCPPVTAVAIALCAMTVMWTSGVAAGVSKKNENQLRGGIGFVTLNRMQRPDVCVSIRES